MLSALLVLVLLLVITPKLSVPAHAATSNVCGEDLTWSFDRATGILSIFGNGKMNDFIVNASENDRPWRDDIESITGVCLPDGLTHIGDYAFCGCTALRSVTIPEGVTRIGHLAFSDCQALEEVTIPESMDSIVDYAFNACPKLKRVIVYSKEVYYAAVDVFSSDAELPLFGYTGVTPTSTERFASCYGIPFRAINQATGWVDVSVGSYFTTPVAWAKERGITNGTTSVTFGRS